MAISYHDPRGVTRVTPEAYTCRHDLKGRPVIGLLANGFPDSVVFLDTVQDALAAAMPAASFKRYAKPGASVPANDKLVHKIADECDALVTAYGH